MIPGWLYALAGALLIVVSAAWCWRAERQAQQRERTGDDLTALNDSLDEPYGLATCQAIWATTIERSGR